MYEAVPFGTTRVELANVRSEESDDDFAHARLVPHCRSDCRHLCGSPNSALKRTVAERRYVLKIDGRSQPLPKRCIVRRALPISLNVITWIASS